MYLKNDTTGQIGEFVRDQIGWSTPTQQEIDDYLLEKAKESKIVELKNKLEVFRNAGFVYNTWTFDLSENSARYVAAKQAYALGGGSKYKFWDKGTTETARVERHFIDTSGFGVFTSAINEEEERLMKLYNSYRADITAAATIAEVDAIIINYSV